MTHEQALELIKQGEGLKVEFKQRFPSYEKFAKEMIAFANTCGGVILLGVDDDKSIFGIESEKSDIELIKETAEKYCVPPINYSVTLFEIKRKEVLLIDIPESKNKPHRIQDYLPTLNLNTAAVYIRVKDKSVLAGKEMIKLMQSQKEGVPLKKYSIGKNEKAVFDFLEKNEHITVKDLSNTANISLRRASRTLINLVRANLLMIHVNENGTEYFTLAS
ncbi:helix-turn-helix domain-containing protein [Melioribacteraceae bacterium 4301-Me]|uniref:AlbA family DNA-binding domain-containing protein n=1 Tax=Pyranulibacter aquaticus TaxID=3163344 RepID=UPI00359AF1D9